LPLRARQTNPLFFLSKSAGSCFAIQRRGQDELQNKIDRIINPRSKTYSPEREKDQGGRYEYEEVCCRVAGAVPADHVCWVQKFIIIE
jgi:hypothetical protein